MAFWTFLAASLPDWDELIDAVMPLSLRVGGVQMSKEEVGARAWADPSSAEALAVRHYYEGSILELDIGDSDRTWNALQDQAERVQRDGTRSRGGSFGVRVVEDGMVQLIIPNTYRVAIEASSGGQVVTNVIGVSAAGGQAQAAAEAVQAAWKVATGPLSRLTGLYALTGFRALDLSSANGDIAFVSDTAAGTRGAGAKSTNGACALVKWNGGTRSRSSRGRLYFGPLMEVDIQTDGRTMETTAATALVTAFGAFRASLASAGFPLCVISPTLSQSFPVTSHAVESVIATQRRRIRS
jgi:hypothetical protein